MTARPGDPLPAAGPVGAAGRATIRLDKWLWQARFVRSRSLAAGLVAEGRLRVNGEPTAKPHRAVGAGDVLTFALLGEVRVVRILATGTRRGPAPEARALYQDLAERGAAAPHATPHATQGAAPGALD